MLVWLTAASVLDMPGTLAAQHDMTAMAARSTLDVLQGRLGSGTAWLPDSARPGMLDLSTGPWSVMAHGSAFGMFDRQWTLHGDSRWTVLDWEMVRAARPVAGGLLRLSAMTSLESLALPDTGYPELLQSGETVGSRRIANVQHPHGLVGELAGVYEYSITSKLITSAYLAAVGEPALGPVAYRHRPSAAADPFAPLGEHWQDASHQSSGVATIGIATTMVQVEGSAFNARESNDTRRMPDYRGARLDSYASRVSVAPAGSVVAAAWAGYLADHDPLDPGAGMQRYGASVLGEARGLAGGRWSTALIWGLNDHHHGARAHDHDVANPPTHHLSSSVLVESTLGVGERTQLFARVEQVQKTADDLGFLGGNLMETFNVRALAIGAVRTVTATRYGSLGIGGRLGVNVLPATLRYTYTTTRPAGFALYVRVLPGADRPM